MTNDVKFPKAVVQLELEGPGGNAFVVLGRAKEALADGGASPQDIDEFMQEAMSDNYDHLIATVRAWMVVVEPLTEWVRT